VPHPSLDAAHLAHLVHDALAGAPAAAPLLLLVEADDDGLSLLAPPAGPGAPLDHLLGLEVPTVDGIVVAGHGRARPLGADPAAEALDVVFGYVLLASGVVGLHCTGPDGPLVLEEAAVGRLPDLCRRALGLPTPPPAVGTGVYLSRRWLDAVLAAAALQPGRSTWPEVAAMHPTAQALGDVAAEDPGWMLLAVRADELRRAQPWEALRRRCARPGSAAPGEDEVAEVGLPAVPHEVAAWLDEGAFSRWLLEPLPTEDDALAALAELLPAEVHRAVSATVRLTAALADPDLDDEDDDDPPDLAT